MIILFDTSPAYTADYYVAPDGSNMNPGTKAKPFQTIQKAADIMAAGDICFIRGGTYRETVQLERSGTEEKPIRFCAYNNEEAVIDGTEPIPGGWHVHKDSIYKTGVDTPFIQLFVDRKMMIEARWPNITFSELFDRSKWATASDSSAHGYIIDPELAKTGVDWTGALATLNVAHQFWTWSRHVTSHSAGSGVFEYPRNLPSLAGYGEREHFGGRYYLSGILAALDSPGEWYCDRATNTLYLWPLDGGNPSSRSVAVKTREYGFTAEKCDYIELDGLHFFGCAFSFQECNHCVINNCHLLFPTYARELTELAANRTPTPETRITGNTNTVKNCSLAFSSGHGLTVRGSQNLVENNLIHDICWNGSLMYVGLRMSAGADTTGGNTARLNSVFNTGNVCISFGGAPDNTVEYNHVYRGGLACKDISMIYTQLPMIEKSVIRYNWVHDCHTDHIALGIRGDDQTRGLCVHHNVVWNVDWDGILIKGDRNSVYNNTCLDNGRSDILVWATPEPLKPWRKQWPLLEKQNLTTEICNNCASRMVGDRSDKLPLPGIISNNYTGTGPMLTDPAHYDFRPKADSPLIDAGKHIPGITDGFKGAAPDIGAYEYGGENWKPGITWNESTQNRHWQKVNALVW